MKTVDKKLSDLKPYKNNPRINDDAVEPVAASIKEFGFKVPMVIRRDNVIVAGHTRYKAAKKLGLKTVPCVIADDLTDEQIKAFRLADNKVAEKATWDEDLLATEISELPDMDMEQFGFSAILEPDNNDNESLSHYANNTNIPQYEITGENPNLDQLADTKKYDELIERINDANIPEDVAVFLRMAATRHIAFNYRNIAEYYAHADEDIQRLMEDSALVLIDFDNAIRDGYITITSELEELLSQQLGGER